MNRLFLLRVFLFISLIVLLISTAASTIVYISASFQVESELKLIFTNEATRAVYLVRNSLINDDLRGARNTLSRFFSSGIIIGYRALNSKLEVVDQVLFIPNITFNSISKTNSTIVPVYFSEGGQNWGSVEFYFNEDLMNQKKRNILKSVIVANLISLLLTLFLLCILYFYFNNLVLQLVGHFLSITKSNDYSIDERSPWSPILKQIVAIQNELSIAKELLVDEKRKAAVADIALQVTHDIRSPLSALNMMMAAAKELSEDKRMIMNAAIQRINDIANGLLKKGKMQNLSSSEEKTSRDSVMLVALLDIILSEKRTQFQEKIDIEIEGNLNQGYGLFANINPIELSRVISNLVNNSIEAFDHFGKVTISITRNNEDALVKIVDNGKGIPPHVLDKLGKREVTFGKDGTMSGSGLGVYHAFQTLKSAGGKIEISSNVGLGTTINLSIPLCDPPNWFLEKLKLRENAVLVSIDDDQSIHQIWSRRLSSLGPAANKIEHLRFTSVEQFHDWFNKNSKRNLQLLVDYEFFNQSSNGLEIIEHLKIQDRAVLVTSRYDDLQIKTKAAALNLKILPKGLAPIVTIEITK